MSGFNRITKERYLEIKDEAKQLALECTDREEKALLVEERRKEFSSEDERIVFIGNLYFQDDNEFLKDYNMYSRNIKLMADNYDIDTYIVRCKVLEMAMFKETKSIVNEVIEATSVVVDEEEENVVPAVDENEEEETLSSDFDDMTDSFLEESSIKVGEISEKNDEVETLQKSLIETIRVAKVNVSRKNEELEREKAQLQKEKEEFESYKREEMEILANERIRLDEEEERLLALKDKIMETIKTFDDAKASLAKLFKSE